LSEREFWGLTPAKFAAMAAVSNRRHEREDYRAGVTQCVVRRLFGDKKAEPLDVFGGKQKPKRRTPPKQVLANFRAYIAAQEAEAKKKGGA